jgi:hypothetical protein
MTSRRTAACQPSFVTAIAGLNPTTLTQANALLDHWDHCLGPCNRPFGAEAWVLEVAGTPVSVAVSASIVSPTVADLRRDQVVELARLCSAPDHAWATRPMLRLWRQIAAPAWNYWPVTAAVAYSQNGRHDGATYRFDGWTRIRDNAGKSPGATSTWTKQRADDHPAKGAKSLWMWRYPAIPTAAKAA